MVQGRDETWLDGEAYAPLLAADRSIFAWEWLRRVPAYRTAAASERGDQALWGLHRFEDAGLGAPAARPIWRVEADPFVLATSALPLTAKEDGFDLSAFAELATIARSSEGFEHLLLSDGLRTIRLDVMSGTLADGPVTLGYSIAGMASARRPLITLRRLLALVEEGRFTGAQRRREARAHRWILELRTHDAIACGARQRDIASVLFGREARLDRWRINCSPLRSQVQRLARRARFMVGGGYCQLMAGPGSISGE